MNLLMVSIGIEIISSSSTGCIVFFQIICQKGKAGFLFEMMQGGSYHDTGDPGFESMQVGGM